MTVGTQAQKIRELESANQSVLAKLEAAGKDLAAIRAEAALAKENLARAMGYIDRINDAERPPTVSKPVPQVFHDEITPPRRSQLIEPPRNGSSIDSYSRYR